MKRATDLLAHIHHELSALHTAFQNESPNRQALLEHCARLCRAQGLLGDLEPLLGALPRTEKAHPRVLYWRLSCALREGRAETLRAEVEAHLQEHEAPELRALYAGTLAPWEEALAESRRAYHALATPLTLYQYGRLHPDAEAGIALLREAVTRAERGRDAYAMTRGGGALVSRLIYAGHYREAAHWGAWALAQWRAAGLHDPLRLMLLVNDLSYARLLCGESQGLSDLLDDRALDGEPPEVAQLYRGTLADYLLSRGDAAGALVHYRVNVERAQRRQLGSAALDLVRGLLEVGEAQAALEVAERAYHLTRGDPPAFHASAQLALGMALLEIEPERAVELLTAAQEHFTEPLEAHRLAQAALHLAWLKLRRGERCGARAALAAAAIGLRELDHGGFRLLVALPEADRDALWELLGSRDQALELYLLGRSEAWLDGQPLPFRLRELEIVTLLALHPEGLTLERLHERLGEPGRGSTKTVVSRLRRKLPISAAPYRLEVGVYSDVGALAQALKRDNLAHALRLYGGALLGDSSAPGIAELRETLFAGLHAAALRSRDVDALITVAERSEGDLRLWEHALALLSPQDTRAPIVRARVRQLRAAWDR